MSSHIAPSLRFFLALTLIAGIANAADDYQPLPLNQLPKAVRDAVMKRFPEAKPQEAHQGTTDNKPYFDVHILVKNQKLWVTCDPDGTIRTIDREITLAELPKLVVTGVQKKYPKAAIRLVNEISEGNATTYEIALDIGKKKLIATFSSTGAFLEETDDEP